MAKQEQLLLEALKRLIEQFAKKRYSMHASLCDPRVEQSLLNSSYDSEDPDCLVLNPDACGYLLFKADGSWKQRNMPVEFCDAMEEAEEEEDDEEGNDPVVAACGCGGRYYLRCENDSERWSASKSFSKAIKEGAAVEAVAFAPNNGYWLRRSDGSTKWLRLPGSLECALERSLKPKP